MRCANVGSYSGDFIFMVTKYTGVNNKNFKKNSHETDPEAFAFNHLCVCAYILHAHFGWVIKNGTNVWHQKKRVNEILQYDAHLHAHSHTHLQKKNEFIRFYPGKNRFYLVYGKIDCTHCVFYLPCSDRNLCLMSLESVRNGKCEHDCGV